MTIRLPIASIGVVAAFLLSSCTSSPSGSSAADELAALAIETPITVESPAFADESPIPPRFSCDGDDVSPPLVWRGVPDGAASLALVVDDPDAPPGTYVHWVLFGVDPSVTQLAEGQVPAGARQAKNSAGDARYKGPCPPRKNDAHRYRFTLYALSDELDAADGADTAEVLDAVGEQAVAKGTLTGTFDR